VPLPLVCAVSSASPAAVAAALITHTQSSPPTPPVQILIPVPTSSARLTQMFAN